MVQPLISVIVPVYKVEEYLDRCVSSLTGQTYRNLEIILVEDGSPDRCGAMCDDWARKDNRIKVIHKVNGGLSDARNAGIAAAAGKLISFVDSDDWLDPDVLMQQYQMMESSGADISVGGILLEYEDGSPSCNLTMAGSYQFFTQEALLELIREGRVLQPACGKLYKSELIRDLRFPVGKYHEDTFWTYQAVSRANKVIVADSPYYHYYQRKGSIMGSGFSLKRLDGLEAKSVQLDYFHSNWPALEQEAAMQLMLSCIYCMQGAIRHLKGQELAKARKVIHETAARISPELFKEINSVKRRILLQFSRTNLVMVARILNFLTDIHILT